MTTQQAPPVLSNPDELFVGGRWVNPRSEKRLTVINPATEQEIESVPEATAGDIDAAVAAGARAFESGEWRNTSAADRAQRLRIVAEALRKRAPDLARAITFEMGAPLTFTTTSCNGPPMLFDYYADMIEALPEVEERERKGGRAFTVVEPVGVVAAIVPWNAPLNLAVLKMAPALAAGCSVILKAAPSTPLNAMILAECLETAGFPAGVVSVLPGGNDAGDALVRDERIDKVTFTGSTAVGQHIAAICGSRIARVALELGGKSPAIILDDMSVEDIVSKLVPASTNLSGQACSALTRVLVSRQRHSEFVACFAAALEREPMGDPLDPATKLGPIAIERQRERVERYIAIGKSEGARLVAGGGRPANLTRGWYVETTLFDRVYSDMTIAKEEIFGPVISVIVYDDEDDAIRIANQSNYGLYASIFTYDDDALWRIGRQLRTGNVGKNGVFVDRTLPYGGFKRSGIGREGGLEGLRSFQEQRTVYLS